MAQRKNQRVWRPGPPKVKFDAGQKEKILSQVQTFIDSSDKLKKTVTRIDKRGRWIYFYYLVEQFDTEGAVFIKPLIDGKYIEFIFARISICDSSLKSCTLDWQRHNDQWMTLYEGALESCLDDLENDETWFVNYSE